MGGGLMQLVAYGAQDIYLTGNPQITFFKVVYRRHTNFSMESIDQTFNGAVGFDRKVSCTISRNGDLIHRMYLKLKLTPGSGSALTLTTGAAHDIVKSVEIEIGGQRIDKHYGEWLDIWNELTQTQGHADAYGLMTSITTTTVGKSDTMYLPLQFWFCRNPGLALPLIALQYHEVKVNVEFGPAAANANSLDATLMVDYIYLDTDERRRFAQVSHEYLIEQLQFTGSESLSNKVKLNFNHPVKELVWVEDSYNSAPTYTLASLQLNGHERFSARDSTYFTKVQPYQHHEQVPSKAGISVYSFALKPEEHQPSGTCNMSRIDNATLSFDFDGSIANKTISVYAVNYNVLRIMSGMGGLAYSN
jgi:hypothetical protein